MSTEEAVTEALNKPVDQNQAAAEDAKKLLAELEAEDGDAAEKSLKPEHNGATNGDGTAKDEGDQTADQAPNKNEDDARGQDAGDRRRHRDDRRGGGRGDRGRGSRGGRGGGRGDKFRRDGGIKSVLTVEEKSDDPVAIRKQVEFYFSDSNLPHDQFLFNKVGGHENNPVELSIIRTFKRMRHFEPMEAIVAALKDSKTLQLTDDDTKVQRRQPLPQTADSGASHDYLRVYEDKAMPRSVYVKGFGEEVPSTQFDIEAFFAQYGPTNAIRLRRTDDKTFKGSVFAEFENEDLAKEFIATEPKPKYKDRNLQIMSKKDYCEKKVEDIKAGKIKPGRDRAHSSSDQRRGRGGKFNSNRRREDDDRDWRTRRDEDRKNGFRDDKRRDNRDGRGDRERRRSVEKDERGIPVVKPSKDPEREKEKEAALAKAKAVVEEHERQQQEADTASGEASKKREREEEVADTEEPLSKKVDAKVEA